MKVHIGPYINWIGPYQIANKICFGKSEVSEKLGEWLAKYDWLCNLCERVYEWRERKIHVKIDKYDTWSMDDTLAYIILPMLKQLQSKKQGSPFVDDEDVPVELRSSGAQVDEYGCVDDNFHKRWDWVLAEMIHAFEWKVASGDIIPDDNEDARRAANGFKLFGKYYQSLGD